jgi:hypothetical protein
VVGVLVGAFGMLKALIWTMRYAESFRDALVAYLFLKFAEPGEVARWKRGEFLDNHAAKAGQ